jgi:hypothetical protein
MDRYAISAMKEEGQEFEEVVFLLHCNSSSHSKVILRPAVPLP